MPDDLKEFENILRQDLNKNPDEEIVNEINQINEKEYLAKIKKKNKKHLIKLDYLERERIGSHIKSLYDKEKDRQKEISDKIDEYDSVFRLERKQLPGTDDDTPNYRTPLSTVNLEVIHANIMNVFFSPKDILRVLPTEEGDIPKIKKLDIFGNWSMSNEMEIFKNSDRLFHSSGKNGECPYIVLWSKEYGTDVKVELVMNPLNPSEPLLDSDTKEVLTQEREISKIIYEGPKLEVFSRKDYIIPSNATADKMPDWEMRKVRFTADKAKRYELEGRFYDGAFDDIGGWGTTESISGEDKVDTEGKEIPLGDTEKIFVEFYGRLRVNAIKEEKEGEEIFKELEDEFIGIVEIISETLCSLKKNKFPLKMRPTGLDLFIPDDEGRLKGIGVMEFMSSIQNSYDALYNQYLFGTIQANNPAGFFTPTGNMRDEPVKIKSGYLYPTADTNSVNIIKFPPPDDSLIKMMENVRNFSQTLLGIGDYVTGVESYIDPRAPAKKAEIVVAQGNVRLNLIMKRKNQTLKTIFKKWFLLYQANMPPNKFMRIAGEDKDNPWKFEKINISDFALNSLPDFELTGNILNVNKQLEVNKKLGTYQVLLTNPLFSPQTREGLQALHALTKWLLDGLDESGVSSFLPQIQGEVIHTPEEENARFLQGDFIEPMEGEDHIYHIKVHSSMAQDPSVPEEIRKNIIEHIRLTTVKLREEVTRQVALSQASPLMGGINGQRKTEGAPVQPTAPVSTARMGGLGAGNEASLY